MKVVEIQPLLCRQPVGKKPLYWRMAGLSRFNGDVPELCGEKARYLVDDLPVCGKHKRMWERRNANN